MAYQGVYIADGFADDCDELMHRCHRAETLTFETFSEIWKEMQMSCMFQGRALGAEIAELSEEALHIAKHYMVADTSNFEESVAGLFLVYSLLNLQPFSGFAALRIVQEDVPAIERIELVARRDRRMDVLYILGSVLIQGPVQFHAVTRERGMEYPLRKYLEGYSTLDKLGVRPKGVFYRQNAELDIIRDLKNITTRYVAAKESIIGLPPCDRNLSYMDPNFPKELDTSLKKLISGIIDNEEEDECSSASGDVVKNIKDKAMKAKVNPIKHLIGVNSRTPEHPHTSGTRTSLSQKAISPTKVATSSKTTSEAPKKKSKAHAKKRKYFETSSEESDYAVDQLSDFQTDDEETNQADLDITKFHQSKLPEDENEQEVEIEIDCLPSVIRSNDDGRCYEIEIIDELDTSKKAKKSEEPSSSASGSKESEKRKTVDKRDLKKTILKSRFKRMGMLPVANFQSKET